MFFYLVLFLQVSLTGKIENYPDDLATSFFFCCVSVRQLYPYEGSKNFETFPTKGVSINYGRGGTNKSVRGITKKFTLFHSQIRAQQ